MCSLINKQLLLTAYAYLLIMEQQKGQQGGEALQMKKKLCPGMTCLQPKLQSAKQPAPGTLHVADIATEEEHETKQEQQKTELPAIVDNRDLEGDLVVRPEMRVQEQKKKAGEPSAGQPEVDALRTELEKAQKKLFGELEKARDGKKRSQELLAEEQVPRAEKKQGVAAEPNLSGQAAAAQAEVKKVGQQLADMASYSKDIDEMGGQGGIIPAMFIKNREPCDMEGKKHARKHNDNVQHNTRVLCRLLLASGGGAGILQAAQELEKLRISYDRSAEIDKRHISTRVAKIFAEASRNVSIFGRKTDMDLQKFFVYGPSQQLPGSIAKSKSQQVIKSESNLTKVKATMPRSKAKGAVPAKRTPPPKKTKSVAKPDTTGWGIIAAGKTPDGQWFGDLWPGFQEREILERIATKFESSYESLWPKIARLQKSKMYAAVVFAVSAFYAWQLKTLEGNGDTQKIPVLIWIAMKQLLVLADLREASWSEDLKIEQHGEGFLRLEGLKLYASIDKMGLVAASELSGVDDGEGVPKRVAMFKVIAYLASRPNDGLDFSELLRNILIRIAPFYLPASEVDI